MHIDFIPRCEYRHLSCSYYIVIFKFLVNIELAHTLTFGHSISLLIFNSSSTQFFSPSTFNINIDMQRFHCIRRVCCF